MRSRALALLLIASCSGSGRPTAVATEPKPVPTVPAVAPRLRPAPGADLAGPVAPPATTPRAAKGDDEVLALGADRPVVAVTLPKPPRGGAASFTFGDGRQGWVARIPDAGQLPSVAWGEGRVFVSGGFASTSMYALDGESGKMLWATQNLNDAGPTAPIFHSDEILFNTYSCTLFVLDAETGRARWSKWIGSETMAQVATHGGLVFAGHPAESGGSELSAYRLKNGTIAWTRKVDGELLAAPVVEGGAVYVSTVGGTTYRFDEQTGKRAWAKRLRATSVPFVVGDTLYLSRRDGKQEAQVTVSAATGAVLATRHTVAGNYLGDVPHDTSNSEAVWSFEGSRSVVADGVQYDAMGGEIRATDPASGEILWTRRYAKGEGKRSVGAVALAGPQLVIATRTGDIYGLDVDTGYTLWSFGLGKRIVAQPIVAKGWVYATTTDGTVIAMQVGDESLDGWHMWGGNSRHNGPTL